MSDRDEIRDICRKVNRRMEAHDEMAGSPCPECEGGEMRPQAMGWSVHRCDSCGHEIDTAMTVP